MDIDDKIKERLYRIKALMERGATEGEREAAETQLLKLLKKHKLTMEDLRGDEAKQWYIFRWKNDQEYKLLIHCAMKACGWPKDSEVEMTRWNYKKRMTQKNAYSILLTRAQNAELEVMYDHYRKAWADALTLYLQAFIQTNDLARPADHSDSKEPEMTPEYREYLRRLFKTMKAIDASSPNKQLEG